jgi:hypothetical protein
LPLPGGSLQPAHQGLPPPTSTPCLAHQKAGWPWPPRFRQSMWIGV